MKFQNDASYHYQSETIALYSKQVVWDTKNKQQAFIQEKEKSVV